jgi:hypothetical protein
MRGWGKEMAAGSGSSMAAGFGRQRNAETTLFEKRWGGGAVTEVEQGTPGRLGMSGGGVRCG